MTRKLFVLVLLGVMAAAGLVASGPRPGEASRGVALDVLFVGNSLIGTHARGGGDTPDVVRRMARLTGRSIRVVKVIRFGSTLQRTWDLGPARSALSGTVQYDVIVLQEFSTLVATDFARAERTLLHTYAPALSRSLKPGGRVILFKNWALADHRPFPTRAANLAAIHTGYRRLARTLPVPTVIAPICEGFEVVRKRGGTGPLMVPDGKHPTGLAVYLDAATLYGVFFGISPRHLPDLYLPAKTATRLREGAARALGYA